MTPRSNIKVVCIWICVLSLTIANASKLKKESRNGPLAQKQEADLATKVHDIGGSLPKNDVQKYNLLSNTLEEESKSPGEISASKSGGNAAVFDNKPVLDATAEPTEDELSDHELPDMELKDEEVVEPAVHEHGHPSPEVAHEEHGAGVLHENKPAVHSHEEHVEGHGGHPGLGHLPADHTLGHINGSETAHLGLESHLQHFDNNDHILGDLDKGVPFVPEHGVVHPHGFEHVVHHVFQAPGLHLNNIHEDVYNSWHEDGVLSNLHAGHPNKVWNNPGKFTENLRGFTDHDAVGVPHLSHGEANRICSTTCDVTGACHQECYCSRNHGCLCTKEFRLLTSICDLVFHDPDLNVLCNNTEYNTNREHYTDVISGSYHVVKHSLCNTRLHAVCK